jgi:hypothetical protein
MKRWLVLALLVLALPVSAQTNNTCEAGEAPDVIVGDLQSVQNYGAVGDYYGYSVGTTSCNIGSCWLKWFSGNDQHPVIGQNMYRIKDGRLDQIGQSWLKHGFYALSETLCSDDCLPTNGEHLGINCSDPYTAGLNGQQTNLGPRSEVNPFTGEYQYPFTTIGESGDNVFKRIKVHRDDLDPALNPGATYFVDGQYITNDDAVAGNGNNNASWRSINVSSTNYNISLTGSTSRMQNAIRGWRTQQPSVKMKIVAVPNDGNLYVGSDTFLNPDNSRRYVYSILNLTSDRGARFFSVPVPAGSVVTEIYFHDVDSHSGEPYDTTDWDAYVDYENSRVVWETSTYDENPMANAIRWGTTYTFGFTVDNPATTLSSTEVGFFKPEVVAGDGFSFFTGNLHVPDVCDLDGICDPGETCGNCPDDCSGNGPPAGFCGDGICDPLDGENCTNCADCNGDQSGADQYCCGDGAGTNPVACADARCTTGGLQCGATSGAYCCGDGSCDLGESLCSCAADCGPVPAKELTCGDGQDNDCDGLTDCGDIDCCTDGACFTGIDNDADGVAECDCDDGNNAVWGMPSEPGTVLLSHSGISGTTVSWSAPASPGAASVEYDTLRSEVVRAFGFTAACLPDPNPADLMSTDTDTPAVGTVFGYLIRATNACPGTGGDGSLGQDSGNNPRGGPQCP